MVVLMQMADAYLSRAQSVPLRLEKVEYVMIVLLVVWLPGGLPTLMCHLGCCMLCLGTRHMNEVTLHFA